MSLVRSPENSARFAPLTVSEWLNASPGFSLQQLTGRVVALHTFQMLCPGCVLHALPQAQRLEQVFPRDAFAVVGLHTVFEHHEAMTPVSLKAFLHEYRIEHPVAVDEPGNGTPVPKTMERLRLRGTPSLLLLDGEGRLRAEHFGRIDDLFIGAQIGALLTEVQYEDRRSTPPPNVDGACDDAGCVASIQSE